VDLRPGEVAKDIPGYSGLYAITTHARIWGYPREIVGCGNRKRWVQPGAWQTPQNAGFGYLQLGLTKDGVRRRRCVHKLVAEVFLPNPRGLSEVNHRDGDKHNNVLSNLEWCTRRENIQHARREGLLRAQNSRYHGVSWNSGKNSWISLVAGQKPVTIGSHETAVEAAAVYNLYVRANGIDAPLNEVDDADSLAACEKVLLHDGNRRRTTREQWNATRRLAREVLDEAERNLA
jgi:hypothetical protein